MHFFIFVKWVKKVMLGLFVCEVWFLKTMHLSFRVY